MRNGVRLPFRSVEEAHQAYEFADLQAFLNLYYQALRVLVNERDFYDLTLAYLRKAEAQKVRHSAVGWASLRSRLVRFGGMNSCRSRLRFRRFYNSNERNDK